MQVISGDTILRYFSNYLRETVRRAWHSRPVSVGFQWQISHQRTGILCVTLPWLWRVISSIFGNSRFISPVSVFPTRVNGSQGAPMGDWMWSLILVFARRRRKCGRWSRLSSGILVTFRWCRYFPSESTGLGVSRRGLWSRHFKLNSVYLARVWRGFCWILDKEVIRYCRSYFTEWGAPFDTKPAIHICQVCHTGTS